MDYITALETNKEMTSKIVQSTPNAFTALLISYVVDVVTLTNHSLTGEFRKFQDLVSIPGRSKTYLSMCPYVSMSLFIISSCYLIIIDKI